MSVVWVIERGPHWEHETLGVAVSIEAAAAFVRSEYANDEIYNVIWDEPKQKLGYGDDCWVMKGSFVAKSGAYTYEDKFDFVRHELHA